MEGLDIISAIAHLRSDKILSHYLDSITLEKRNPSKDVYTGLLKSIVSQQLSVKAAETIYGRFLDLFEDRIPDADKIPQLTDDALRGAGLSGQKTGYIRNVVDFFSTRELFDVKWDTYSDDAIIKQLSEIKGVGKWTVEMILMFVLKRPDVFPVLDLGIQKGMKRVYGLTTDKKELHKEMVAIAEQWRPYRTVACLFLWEVGNGV